MDLEYLLNLLDKLKNKNMTAVEKPKGQNQILWATLLKGVLLIVLGIWMLRMPKESFEAMAFVIGLIVVLGGVAESFFSYRIRRAQGEWGWNFSGGIIDIIIGIFLMINPMAILALITIFISFWLILFSILIIRKSVTLKRLGREGWGWNLFFGIFLLVLGMVLIWHPQAVGVTLIFWLAFSFLTLGIFRIILAFQARNFLRNS